ncbi:MAG: 60S ribosomal protein L35 [Amphiamblys sp. WSBS2006]|nr:MAG: 60S ribosomal protein L35 [Amphiamblys sp. WSBS2006]
MTTERMRCFREMSVDGLVEKLHELKKDLSSLRIQKNARGSEAKVSELRDAKKDVARVMTVLQEKKIAEATSMYRAGSKKVPVSLRPRLTRAKRREMSAAQKKKRSRKQQETISRRTPYLFMLKA